MNVENDGCVLRKIGREGEQVDSSHDAAVGWERAQHGGPTVESGPMEKRLNRETVAEGGHTQS